MPFGAYHDVRSRFIEGDTVEDYGTSARAVRSRESSMIRFEDDVLTVGTTVGESPTPALPLGNLPVGNHYFPRPTENYAVRVRYSWLSTLKEGGLFFHAPAPSYESGKSYAEAGALWHSAPQCAYSQAA